MASKVKCTCGWSWNKSDSSKKDMYICHECGRDNSNNMKNGGDVPQAQHGKKVPKETEADRAKRVAQEAANATGVGIALDQVPGLETLYDAYNVIDGYRQGDPMKILPNMMGALIPGTAGKAFEAITNEYLPKTPKKEKEKMKAVLKGKRATSEEMRKAQESVDWSEGFKKLYDDVGNIDIIDNVIAPLMGLKNGGWLDNYNDYNVSAPEGFEGDGYSNVGRTTSPAWGGQFQMGGVLPGAVGHMYARHGAPSEGKYAKKTLPSAQNGQEMQYYQKGLDWQPKTISKNGAWLDKAQTGAKKFKLKDERDLVTKPAESTNVKKKNFDLEQDKERKNYLSQLADQQKENSRRKKLTQDQREREDYNARNEERGSIQAHVPESTWDRTKAIVSNPLTAFGYAARNESLPERFQHGERNALDTPIDFINPLQGVAALSEIPGELGRGEYLNAGLSALDAVDLGVYAKGAMKASKPFLQKAGTALGTESGLLSNAYKYNPWAFKSNPEAYYRTLGKEGIDDAFNSGVIRPKQTSNIYSPEAGKRIDVNAPAFPEGSYFNKSGLYSTNDLYNPDYIAEVVGKDELFTYPKKTVFNENIRVAPNNIPIEEANFYKKDWLQGYKEVPKQEDGGIIKDDRGQWDHPGEITEIGSNEITMEGVPYDVLGISDTGDTKLMKPGKNYKFKGKKVTEYPLAKNGVKQQLDQLTNFSNYNNKQPGGWLDNL